MAFGHVVGYGPHGVEITQVDDEGAEGVVAGAPAQLVADLVGPVIRTTRPAMSRSATLAQC